MRDYMKVGMVLLALGPLFFAGCVRPLTRFEESISLTHDQGETWRLSWSTIARRGIETVSNGNVGGAHMSWQCRPHPSEPLTWILNTNEDRRKASGAAADVFAKHTTNQWSGTVTFNPTEKIMVLNIIDSHQKSFVGKRRYAANGNGETYVGQ